MEVGKLPNRLLEEIIISNIKTKRKEVIERAGVGKDCAVIDYGNKYCVISSDPITGATENIGKIAVNVACNDIGAAGAEPNALLMTILAPKGTEQKEIERIMKEANEAADLINVEIVGGHTEVTDAVNKMVLSLTALGMRDKEINNEPVKTGDLVLISKEIGIEGTSILYSENKELLDRELFQDKNLSSKKVEKYIDRLSVVKEGVICGKLGSKYMHDITEGGIYGALWEAHKANNLGILVEEDSIPISAETKALCNYFDINPYRLISSGSMLIIASKEDSCKMIKKLKKENIRLEIIGEIIDEKKCLTQSDKEINEIDEPGSDELYKVVTK
ncbi:MAG: AIR synthase family protein [Bacillota bacterium]|nr:AIR synthase family protein [Bacillota bacterium]